MDKKFLLALAMKLTEIAENCIDEETKCELSELVDAIYASV